MLQSYSQEKILSIQKLSLITASAKARGKTIALCHGCFDILHTGHLRHFEVAKHVADIVIVTVTPDRFIRKGPGRPVFPEDQRAELVAGLLAVDWVGINEWESATETLRLLQPSFFVKGQEYETRAQEVNPNFLLEITVVKEIGAQMIFTNEETHSSTAAYQKLIS